MLFKYLRRLHNSNLAEAMDGFYKRILKDERYQELNLKWGHQKLQFNLETSFERNFRDQFFEKFEGSILEIGCGLTPLQFERSGSKVYTGIDLALTPSRKFPHITTIDFHDYSFDHFDLIYSQDCLMPRMAKRLKVPKKAFIICNGVEGLDGWIRRVGIDKVIEVEGFLPQVEKMRDILVNNECDDWIKRTRVRELESILKLNLKRYILVKKSTFM